MDTSNRLRFRGYQDSKGAGFKLAGEVHLYQPVELNEHALPAPEPFPRVTGAVTGNDGAAYRDNAESARTKVVREAQAGRRLFR